MNASEHPCPVRKCPVPLTGRQLICLWHWRMLPQRHRTAIWSTWRNSAGKRTAGHYEAIRAALSALERTER